jgi:pheromone shutdown protein TraB
MQQMKGRGGDFRYSPSPSELLSLPGLLRWLQQEIGKEFGVMPGLEMVSAVDAARENGVMLGLIDRPVGLTISRMWEEMPFGEKVRLMGYIGVTAGVFLLRPIMGKRAFGLASAFSGGEELTLGDLEGGKGVKELMSRLGTEFPTIYRALVEERNVFMVNNIIRLLEKFERVVVVVGLGHVEGMEELLLEKGVGVEVR